ncbi:hypothetical protein [Nocardia pseudobrasiliensis]|uniref:Uncharacterized protein n=1 Tax=Nocardia pseudobrasiliensis TaxID=45979 RepID=A0A370HS30_9NOCA|nr:hypothetical protein [Nocardia pseudobrasiliensis]RDI61343.1 hypothetical protein DFR76_11468 [Nocardia pseudobrasiliensis]
MTPEPVHTSAPPRGPWFGPTSFRTASIAMCVNVFPVLIVSYLIVVLGVVYAVELIAVPVLCAMRGRARQIGTGLGVSLVGTLACFVLPPALAALFGQ